MPTPENVPSPQGNSGSLSGVRRAAQVIIVSSVMFTFISYWRTAAVVLCDLASTAYYIGAIVEQSIGPAAPWFILAVMVFSYAVRSVYIESCSLFVRGGVYKVVKEAMGGFLGKLSVSALMFDYILTGPISGVAAGQYLLGLVRDTYLYITFGPETAATHDHILAAQTAFAPWLAWGSVLVAIAVTIYFFRQNVIGIHESSDKAMKIMIATTVMAVVIFAWCGLTLAVKGAQNPVPLQPNFNPQMNYDTGQPEVATGWLANTWVQPALAGLFGQSWLAWLTPIGAIGVMLAFSHSILAMSGEETLAQVYREVESPKMKNFKKAAFIVFLYSVILTGGISFLAVLLIPNADRMAKYSGNLLGGLAMNVWGPQWAGQYPQLFLNAFVVIVGFLILAGAVNTAIIGSNGVLNRVAEDGVMPDWFLKPHPRYGTTYRILYLIVILQLITIVASGGNVLLLGEAYAFGVVWSFVFKALAMVVLRFKDKTPREYKVPLNFRIAGVEVPVGLILIFLVLLAAALLNLLTKQVATISGLIFTFAFWLTFTLTEFFHERRRKDRGKHHTHMEQFNRATTEAVTPETVGMNKPYRKLVSIRSVHNLFMLEKALAETDPTTTSVVVMTAKMAPMGQEAPTEQGELDAYDQQLMTAVVTKAEHAGKQVKPMIVPTNNPLHAVLKTAMDLKAQELILGASNKYTVDEQLEQIAFYWINLHGGQPAQLTVRILSRERDVYLDLAGGSRIPKISERSARTVAELRAAGVGVDRVLMLHDGSRAHSDLFQAVLTMLDPEVALGLLPVAADGDEPIVAAIHEDAERARKVGRGLAVLDLPHADGAAIVERLQKDQYDLVILPLVEETQISLNSAVDERGRYILRHAHCRVFLAASPSIPQEVVDRTPSVG